MMEKDMDSDIDQKSENDFGKSLETGTEKNMKTGEGKDNVGQLSDLEGQLHYQRQISYQRYILDQALVTKEMLEWKYDGSGTEDDPYVVTWIENDPRNAMQFPQAKKWSITVLVALITLAAAFMSSSYSGCLEQIEQNFNVSEEIILLGLALYVLGFAVGPLLWAPLGELYGRQIILFITYGALTAFNAGSAGSPNIQTLLVCRFFAGAFSSSSLTNSGGVIADMFPTTQRGLAMALFAMAPFMGPVLGPIVGGFLGQSEGWRWVEGASAIFSGILWILAALLIPETYAPLLLQKRADKLSQLTGNIYRSRAEIYRGRKSANEEFSRALLRPWSLLVHEPIVIFFSIYMSVIYGTLYMLFGAMPIVYQEKRGWNEGQGGLAFLGIMIGMLCAILYSVFDNKRYLRRTVEAGGNAAPEDRLPCAMIGGISIPIGLFWFAWTNSPDIHFLASISAGIPFGFGMVLIFISIKNYLVDSYTVFAASAIAVTVVMRSAFGAAFPLFTTYMFHGLGIHWASTLIAFLSLICAPIPFLFYRYGAGIRKRCKYAAEADAFTAHIAS